MKVIFLDIDGVLNTNSNREISDDKLKLLSKLVSETDAKIILSSSWRNWWNHPKTNIPGSFITNWKNQFVMNNIFVDLTIEPEIPKSVAINKYLSENKIENYVVLDDEPIFKNNLILIDCNKGLTEIDISKAVTLLCSHY